MQRIKHTQFTAPRATDTEEQATMRKEVSKRLSVNMDDIRENLIAMRIIKK